MILVRTFPLIKDISYTERQEAQAIHSTPSQQEIG